MCLRISHSIEQACKADCDHCTDGSQNSSQKNCHYCDERGSDEAQNHDNADEGPVDVVTLESTADELEEVVAAFFAVAECCKCRCSLYWGKCSLYWGKCSLYWGKCSLYGGKCSRSTACKGCRVCSSWTVHTHRVGGGGW